MPVECPPAGGRMGGHRNASGIRTRIEFVPRFPRHSRESPWPRPPRSRRPSCPDTARRSTRCRPARTRSPRVFGRRQAGRAEVSPRPLARATASDERAGTGCRTLRNGRRAAPVRAQSAPGPRRRSDGQSRVGSGRPSRARPPFPHASLAKEIPVPRRQSRPTIRTSVDDPRERSNSFDPTTSLSTVSR